MDDKGAKRLQQRKLPKQERSIQRLDAILAAARSLIARKGINSLKMTDIAAEAGIPIGSLYQFFPEKAAIIRAIHDDFTSRVEGGTERTFGGVKTLEEAEELIQINIDRFYDSFINDPVYLPVWLSTMSDADLQSLNQRHLERLTEILKKAFCPLLPEGHGIDLDTRIVQLIVLSGTVVRFALLQQPQAARKTLDEWKRTVRESLFVR